MIPSLETDMNRRGVRVPSGPADRRGPSKVDNVAGFNSRGLHQSNGTLTPCWEMCLEPR
jgi:hypothetical protein